MTAQQEQKDIYEKVKDYNFSKGKVELWFTPNNLKELNSLLSKDGWIVYKEKESYYFVNRFLSGL